MQTTTQTNSTTERLSLRDPAGQLFDHNGRLIRYVNATGVESLLAALSSEAVRRETKSGTFIQSTVLKEELKPMSSLHTLSQDGMFLEHPRVRFASYPHEWSPHMLYVAGKLTLRLARELIKEGLGLKDATPHNIQFRGTQPVFVDVLSVEKRDPLDPTWVPFAQFVRNFINPLLVNKYFGLPLDMVFLTHRDGLEPEEVYRMLPVWKRFTRPFLSLVSIPTWLGRRKKTYSPEAYKKRLVNSNEKAVFVLETFFKQLERALDSVRPKQDPKSTWSDYMGDALPYEHKEFKEKEHVVEKWIKQIKPKYVLDVGCNSGHFSRLAARTGASVVGLDYDPTVVGQSWKTANAEKLDVLPLRVDLTRPTPSVGWKNRENLGFLERASGKFDFVLMLAVVHHMMVSEGIPLEEIVELLSQLGADTVLIEYVDPKDATFKQIARGRENLYRSLSPQSFEREFKAHYQLKECHQLGRPTRRLYLFTK